MTTLLYGILFGLIEQTLKCISDCLADWKRVNPADLFFKEFPSFLSFALLAGKGVDWIQDNGANHSGEFVGFSVVWSYCLIVRLCWEPTSFLTRAHLHYCTYTVTYYKCVIAYHFLAILLICFEVFWITQPLNKFRFPVVVICVVVLLFFAFQVRRRLMQRHERRLQSCKEIVREHLDKLGYAELELFDEILADQVYTARSSADDIASDLRRASTALARAMTFKNAGKVIIEDVSERVVIVRGEVQSLVKAHLDELCSNHTRTIFLVRLLLESRDKLAFNTDVLKRLGTDESLIESLIGRR